MEISTERGANILFQYKCIHRTKVLEGIRKKCYHLYNSPTVEIPNANDDPVLHDIVKKMHDTRSLEQTILLLLAALPRNARYTKFMSCC